MFFSIILFILSWICFAFFANLNRFFSIVPTSFISMYISAVSDLLVRDYPLWDYPAPNHMLALLRTLFHSLGVYPVVTYLFLQTLPKVQTAFKVIRHVFYWSLLAAAIEFIAVKTGNMGYGLWWNMKFSYAADWFLFLLFYWHHKWMMKLNTGRRK